VDYGCDNNALLNLQGPLLPSEFALYQEALPSTTNSSGFGDIVQADMSNPAHRLLCNFKQKLNDGLVFKPPLQAGKTCAVVSGAGTMLAHEQGTEIDSHDIVLRFNEHPTTGYEKYVGTRTTWRYAKWHAPPKNLSERIHDTVAFGPSDGTLHSMMQGFYPNCMDDEPRASNDWLTSGFYGMMIALSNCAIVDGYGFVSSLEDANLENTLYKYYAPGCFFKHKNDPVHGWFPHAEHDIWARLTVTDRNEWSKSGKTQYLGFSSVQCPSNVAMPGPLDNVVCVDNLSK